MNRLLKVWFLILVSAKGQKWDKREFVTKICRNYSFYIIINYSYRLLSCKNISQIPCKIFAVQCYFTDHLKRKTLHKITLRTPLVNPLQLCVH